MFLLFLVSSHLDLNLSFDGTRQAPVQFRQHLQSKRLHPTLQGPNFKVLAFSPLNLHSSSVRDGDHGKCPVPLLIAAHDRFTCILDGLLTVDFLSPGI